MKSRRILTLVIAAVMLVSAIPFTASASSDDRRFTVKFTNRGEAGRSQVLEKKDNSSSAFIKYNSGPYQFIAIINGGPTYKGTGTDCTSKDYYSGKSRKPAVVTRGTKGYVRQDVYERYGGYGRSCYAELYKKFYGYYGEGSGMWSPDSVYETGCRDYN